MTRDAKPTLALRRQVLKRDGWRCYLCGVALEPEDSELPTRATVDHYYPRALGGRTIFANLRACCWACNQAKGDRPPGAPLEPVAPRRERLAERHAAKKERQELRKADRERQRTTLGEAARIRRTRP